ncbi:MAG: ACP S-malonyltransferase [Candidatus Poribacteria bacterium]|nr:ACP S-malonyltransferase [Candidatus Poribacteria bacterium]
MDVAFIFPGQGSQKVGMGLELAQAYTVARDTFEEADSLLGRRLSRLCFDGPDELLKQTENTQLAILTCSVAALRVLRQLNISSRIVAGHSLGEHSALVAAGVFSFPDALKLIEYRARFMAEASQQQDCTMAAILGLEEKRLETLCEEVKSVGIVEIANYNCPGQLVISGETAAVQRLIATAKANGAKRCRPLAVSGAFHSSLMESARVQLESVIGEFTFNNPQNGFVANVTGECVQRPDEIRRLLIAQVTSPVRWEKSILTMGGAGISHFVEVGPGNVLSGMVRRTLPQSLCLNVEDLKSLGITVDAIGRS